MARHKTKQEVFELFESIHGDRFDYTSSVYNGYREPITIRCRVHGEFTTTPYLHQKATTKRCPPCTQCANDTKTEQFLNELEARSKFYNNFTYEKLRITDSRNKIIVTCKEHGDIEIDRRDMFNKMRSPCSKCTNIKRKSTINQQDIINQFIEKHGDRFDYSQTKITYLTESIIVTCKEHGPFKTYIYDHLNNKRTCPRCKIENYGNKKSWKEIRKSFEASYPDRFDYSGTVYDENKNMHQKISIRCIEHDTAFETLAYTHTRSSSCPKCKSVSISSAENDIFDYVKSLSSDAQQSNRSILSNSRELDIVVPSKQIAIEYNGLYWHSTEWKAKNYHLDKTDECITNDYKLIHIFEDEWLNKRSIVESRLANALNKTKTKLYARKTKIKAVDSKTARKFMSDNHIQGNCNASYKFGLYYDNQLVSMMTFGSLRKINGSKHVEGHYELLRFCNTLDTTVVGGASKLLKHFVKTVQPEHIISYACRRWSDGNLYRKLGFTFEHNSTPSYAYVMNSSRIHRANFQKHKLIVQGFDETLTESEIMTQRGIHRIYDCGTSKWSMQLSNVK